MVYSIVTVTVPLLLFLTVVGNAFCSVDMDEIQFLPSHYVPQMIRFHAIKPELFKRQGIIPGPRVGRRSADPRSIYQQQQASTMADSLHEIFASPVLSLPGRNKRSLGRNDDASSNGPSSTGSNGGEDESNTGMSMFTRNSRQLIPAPRVGRSSSSSSNSIPANGQINLITGYNQAAAGPFSGDVAGDSSYESDGQRPGYQLVAIPRAFLSQHAAKDLFKRVALTPRIGRSELMANQQQPSAFNLWSDDDDYYSRVVKSSFTPRVGRSVRNNDKS